MADTSQDTPRATAPVPVPRRRVLAWALWDWGSAAFQAVITTFVFTRWITSDAFVDPAVVAAAEAEAGGDGPANALLDATLADHSAWLGWGLAGAGLLIALLAPVTGSSADRTGRRKRWLGVHTALTVLLSISMFLVTPDPASLEQNLLLGIFLLAAGHVFFELAGVNYNAMLAQVSTPGTVGKVSGIGWGAGYVGGIVLLLLLFVGFIDPEVGWFGVTDEGGLDIRVAVLFSALWFAVFALPVFFAVPELPVEGRPERRGVVAAYRSLGADVVRLWRTSRATVRFLVASAVYRDGLSGVFVFGAIIASTTFGFSAGEVIQFAIAANVVAGLATIAAGWLDDRVGPKAVVVGSLVGLVVAGTAVFLLHDAGQGAFWVFGLLLCVFVGPAQSASRSLLARLSPEGHESELFGLYATTGRAAGFLASFAFSTTIAIAGEQYWGVLGIMAVLLLGLVLLLPVKVGGRHPSGATVPGGPSGTALGDAPDGAR